MVDEVTWTGGKLVHSKVTDKVNPKIEKGALSTVHAIVVHQTGAATAASSFASYEAGENGAHFLIDTDVPSIRPRAWTKNVGMWGRFAAGATN